jgi:hypothetical protein
LETTAEAVGVCVGSGAAGSLASGDPLSDAGNVAVAVGSPTGVVADRPCGELPEPSEPPHE